MADPTYEELRVENAELKARLEAAEAQVAALQTQLAQQADVIVQLQAQLAALQVRWVQRAVEGALAETRLYHRSVFTNRCAS
jgi:chromosome segregation ATPase